MESCALINISMYALQRISASGARQAEIAYPITPASCAFRLVSNRSLLSASTHDTKGARDADHGPTIESLCVVIIQLAALAFDLASNASKLFNVRTAFNWTICAPLYSIIRHDPIALVHDEIEIPLLLVPRQ